MKQSVLSIVLMFAASGAVAQHSHQTSSPGETGQSQFAAIAEIVTLLSDDPETDWTQVNVKALRDHLVDMDNVTTRALVERTVGDMSVIFSVTGDSEVAQSIQRMVLAHGPMLQRVSGWTVRAAEQEAGATMQVQVTSPEDLDQVKGLGFFGLMTIGAHHQQHHILIAKGHSPH